MALDTIVYTIFEHYGGQSIEKEIPRSFTRKTAFIKKAAKLPALHPHADDMLAIVRRLGAVADDRNWLVHGSFGDPETFEATGELVIGRTVRETKRLRFIFRRMQITDIDSHAARLRPMMNELMRISNILAAPFKSHADEASG